MSAPRQTRRLEQLQAMFAERGIRPTTKMGQNFLLDKNQVYFVIRCGHLTPDDVVLEVGPGTGFLTQEMAASGCRMLAVEMDRKLIHVARESVRDYPNVEFMEGDILETKNKINPAVIARLKELVAAKGATGGLKCISNLPYSSGTPFVANMFSSDLPWTRGVFLLQLEVVERMLADPGCDAFGSLSIVSKIGGTVTLERKVPPQVFWPRPRVASAVISVDFRPVDERMALPWKGLRRVTSAVFNARRKNLRNAFKGVIAKELGGADAFLDTVDLDTDVRGEQLQPDDFLVLATAFEAWEAKHPPKAS